MEQKKNYEMPKSETIEIEVSGVLCASDMDTPAREFDGFDE